MSRNATATRNAHTETPAPAEAASQQSGPEPERPAPSLTLDLPLVTTTIRTPHFAIPAVDAVANAAREHMPSRRNALFYAGLAGTAAVGLIPWPVAVAIGIGTAVAQRDPQH